MMISGITVPVKIIFLLVHILNFVSIFIMLQLSTPTHKKEISPNIQRKIVPQFIDVEILQYIYFKPGNII